MISSAFCRFPACRRQLGSLSQFSSSTSSNPTPTSSSTSVIYLALASSLTFLAMNSSNDPSLSDAPPKPHTTVIPLTEIAKNDHHDRSTPCWSHLDGKVYDITSFISSHPGGKEKISMACGTKEGIAIWWKIYRQHLDLKEPHEILSKLHIGVLPPSDILSLAKLTALNPDDPYSNDPDRHPALNFHSNTPCNAETPEVLLTQEYFTPNDIFYVRHHHPVPVVSDAQNSTERMLRVEGVDTCKAFSVDELKKMKQRTVVATLQCSGNRRGSMNAVKKTSGTSWGQGAISNGKWEGVPVKAVLEAQGIDIEKLRDNGAIQHVIFYGMDGMQVSIDKDKALDNDTILALKLNDAPMPRDHGGPIRLVVPGYVGVRNCKWVNGIKLSKDEAVGDWQRGLNYKLLPPQVDDAKAVDLSKIPAMLEAALYSGITAADVVDVDDKDKNRVLVDCKGWAWAGGGRKIARLDLTGDDGKSWSCAELLEGKDQDMRRAWAWTFWEGQVWCTRDATTGKVIVSSRAVDQAYNVQPKEAGAIWNVRGLNNGSWFKREAKEEEEEEEA